MVRTMGAAVSVNLASRGMVGGIFQPLKLRRQFVYRGMVTK